MKTPNEHRVRTWLTAGAMLGGIGSALVTGSVVASADTGSASAGASSERAHVAKVKATSRPKPAPKPAAAAAAEDDDWGKKSYLPDNEVIVPGAAVRAALQQISTSQDQLHAQTWGTGNIAAGVVSLVPQAFLAQASWALNGWQNNIEAAKASVADTEGIPIAHELAQLSLFGTLMLPTVAGMALDAARATTPLVGFFGAQQAATEVEAVIDQAKQNGQVYAVRLLQTVSRTQQIIYLAPNGGIPIPVQLDTGSSGLSILGKFVPVAGRGESTGSGEGGYGGDVVSVTYRYHTYMLSLDFGGGAITAPGNVMIVDAESEAAYNNYGTASIGTGGTFGVGANTGKGPTLNALLPGELRDGILMYQNIIGPWGLVVFGPNPLPSRGSVNGAPIGDIQIQINDGPRKPLRINIDSGGGNGNLPSDIVGSAQMGTSLKPGTVITVYTADGNTKLYSYTVDENNSPAVYDAVVHPGEQPLTGAIPFELSPIYFDYSPAGGLGAVHWDHF